MWSCCATPGKRLKGAKSVYDSRRPDEEAAQIAMDRWAAEAKVVCPHDRALRRWEGERNGVVYRKGGETDNEHVTLNKPDSEKHTSWLKYI